MILMSFLAVMLVVALPQAPPIVRQTRFVRAANHIKLPSKDSAEAWREKGRQHERVVDLVMNRRNWVEGLKRIESRLGFFEEELEITVTLEEWDGQQAALGGGTGGKGAIKFNMKTLATYQKRIEEFETLQKEGKLKIYVPPTQIKRTVWHELTHVFQDPLECPDWFREGMACTVEQNPSVLRSFAYNDRKVKSLKEEPPKDEVYARGWLFWLWLEEAVGARGVKQIARATCLDGMKWKSAVEATTELRWEKILAQEQKWSAKHIRSLREEMGLK